MKLRKDWKYLLNRAWSVKLVFLTAVSSTFPLFVTEVPTVWFAALTMLLAVLTALARVSDQPGMDRREQDDPVEEERRK